MIGTNTALHLVTSPQERLVDLEHEIRVNLKAFVIVGNALAAIKHEKLYRLSQGGKYETFEAYCKAELHISRSYGYRLIEAAQADAQLSPIGDTADLTESVLRAVTTLPDVERRQTVFQRAKAHATTEGRAVTARDVYSFVREEKGDPDSKYSWIIRPTDSWNFISPHYQKLDIEGEDGPHGYVCGDFYADCLWYYSRPDDVVCDPMAGSGQLLRVYADRALWMKPEPWELKIHLFDLSPRGPYQDRIHQHDLRASFPLPHADYIILDPPYFGLVKGQYSTKPDDLANMDLAAWLVAMDDIARSCSSAQVVGGRCTIVTTNYRNFSTKKILLIPDLVREAMLRHGYQLYDKAYMSTHQQQEEGMQAARTNNLAKKHRRLRNEMAEVLTFLKQT